MKSTCTSYVLIFSLFAGLSACSVTVGSTEGSSESFENTSESAETSSEASTEFSSSTSPRGEHHSHKKHGGQDDVQKQKEEARRFIRKNYMNVKTDAALGEGEYLTALAEIFRVPLKERSAFYSRTKALYTELFASGRDDLEATVDLLYSISHT